MNRLARLAACALLGACLGGAPPPQKDTPPMTLSLLVAVDVIDADAYATYRRGMEPLLAAAGGAFDLDLEAQRVLKAPEGAPFTRLFVLRFPSAEAQRAFFADPRYRAVKDAHFDRGVRATRVLASFPGRIR